MLIRRYAAGAAVLAVAMPVLAVVGAAPAAAKCTNQIDYAGDPRSNAEINSIGATTGICPAPLVGGAGASNSVPGITTGVYTGQPCSNTQTFIFGISMTGQPMACGHAMDGGGIWGPALALVGVRPVGSPCTEANLVAQGPAGEPLVCGAGVWVVQSA